MLNESNYQIIKSDKFKTNYIQVRYLLDATKENTSYASLLSMYLTYCNNETRTFKETIDKLDSLFGTKFDIGISLKGKYLTFDFVISFVAGKYIINNDNYVKEVVDTFLTYIFKPFIDDNAFSKNEVELKKYELVQRIRSSYDDKFLYASEQFSKVFAKGYPLELNTAGYIEDVEAIDENQLYNFYKKLISGKVIVGGMLSEDDYDLILSKLEEKIDNTNYLNNLPFYNIKVNNFEEKIEKQNLNQSKILIGYTITNELNEQNYYTYLLINALLGMASNSYLFRIVREKENLCYTIRSSYDQYSNSMVIIAGIEKENYDKTVSLVKDIIQAMKEGKITSEELEDAKLVMIDLINKVADGQGGMVNFYMNRCLQELPTDLAYDVKMIKDITITEIVNKMQNVELKTIYFLSGENNE